MSFVNDDAWSIDVSTGSSCTSFAIKIPSVDEDILRNRRPRNKPILQIDRSFLINHMSVKKWRWLPNEHV